MKSGKELERAEYISWLKHKNNKEDFQQFIITTAFRKKLKPSTNDVFYKSTKSGYNFCKNPRLEKKAEDFWKKVPVIFKGRDYLDTNIKSSLFCIDITMFSWQSIYRDWTWDAERRLRIHEDNTWCMRVNYWVHIAGLSTSHYSYLSWNSTEFEAWRRDKKINSLFNNDK